MQSPSPLRYPGGKTKLYPYIKNIIDYNQLYNCTYIEPFAGGSGLAISLLQNKLVNNIVINDYDYAIYSFWHSILEFPENFCQLIYDTPITVEQWDIQKNIYLRQDEFTLLEIGFASFFLNRTNRSGIITGGMIGGRQQQGNYLLDCRFNKRVLIKKIEKIAAQANQIQIMNLDVFDLIDTYLLATPTDNTFIYFDPPYVKKGPQLYKNFFDYNDHARLSAAIKALPHKWLVTYDHVDEIAILYQQYMQDVININYSAGRNKLGQELAIFSPVLMNPN